jgi:hypothetical protein
MPISRWRPMWRCRQRAEAPAAESLVWGLSVVMIEEEGLGFHAERGLSSIESAARPRQGDQHVPGRCVGDGDGQLDISFRTPRRIDA